MTDIIHGGPAARLADQPDLRVIPTAVRRLPMALWAALRFAGSAVHRWWITRSGAHALAALDDATLRDLAIVRSDAERVARSGRR